MQSCVAGHRAGGIQAIAAHVYAQATGITRQRRALELLDGTVPVSAGCKHLAAALQDDGDIGGECLGRAGGDVTGADAEDEPQLPGWFAAPRNRAGQRDPQTLAARPRATLAAHPGITPVEVRVQRT